MDAETKWSVNQSKSSGRSVGILIVDNDPRQLEALRIALCLHKYQCFEARSAEEAFALIQNPEGRSVDAILLDMSVPGGTGLRLVQRVKAIGLDIPVIAIAGLRHSASLNSIQKMGIPVLQKPFDPEKLYAAIQQLTE